jgi:hypothetical protein
MTLPVVPLDSPNEKQHRTVIATSLNELVKFFNTIKAASWTPAIRGTSTAGTYEIASNRCRYARIGRLVFLTVDITMAPAVTGGGTGALSVTGIPFAKIANSYPVGAIRFSGVDWSAGANIVVAFDNFTASSTLVFQETNDNAANSQVGIAGLAASDVIFGSIWYETDDQ